MSSLSKTLSDKLKNDPQLALLLSKYHGEPAVFTTDPIPGDAPNSYIVTVGEVVSIPWDTKTSRGRDIIRDIRIYTSANGDAILVEDLAERVRNLFHRQFLSIDGFQWVISGIIGPIVADEQDYYARIISLNLKIEEV